MAKIMSFHEKYEKKEYLMTEWEDIDINIEGSAGEQT